MGELHWSSHGPRIKGSDSANTRAKRFRAGKFERFGICSMAVQPIGWITSATCIPFAGCSMPTNFPSSSATRQGSQPIRHETGLRPRSRVRSQGQDRSSALLAPGPDPLWAAQLACRCASIRGRGWDYQSSAARSQNSCLGVVALQMRNSRLYACQGAPKSSRGSSLHA